jgi:hypothetical protein
MRVYVKSIGETNMTLVDIDAGVKFTVPCQCVAEAVRG